MVMLTLREALEKCFDECGYSIPSNYSISKSRLLDHIASGVSSRNGALGMASSTTWTKFIRSVFFDKTCTKLYKTWLLSKLDLRHCTKCNLVYPTSKFHKTKASSTGYQAYCIDCYRTIHREAQKPIEANRRAAKLARTPTWANLEKIKEFYMLCPLGYTVDHIIPLQGELVSGLHVHNNLQYLTASDNSAKGNKYEVL